jgi:hypothetical protein
MTITVLMCLLLTADAVATEKVDGIDPSYKAVPRRAASFTPAPMLPEEIYRHEENRIAETLERVKAESDREERSVSAAAGDGKVRRSDAVRVMTNVKRSVNSRLEDPKVAQALESLQVPAGDVVPRGFLAYAIGELLRLARRAADDNRVFLEVTTLPTKAIFTLCLEYDATECVRVSTPGSLPGMFRGKYKYTIELDGHKKIEEKLNLVRFAQSTLDCQLYALTERLGPNPCTPR